jgi:catechol 2,3-dioxygenase
MDKRFFNQTHVGRIDLWVNDLGRSAEFYEQALGLSVKDRSETSIEYTANDRDVILAIHKTDAPLSKDTYGLYHVAFLVPERKSLGRFLRHLIDRQIPIGGAADHHYSEAIYLRDPDGNGIEVACDKPDVAWRDDFGQLKTTTEAFDYEGVFYAAGSGRQPFTMPKDTTIGHLHLNGKNINAQHIFYEQVLGFERYYDDTINAMFFSRSKYHHHIAVNDWLNRRKPKKGKQNGLHSFTIRSHNIEDLENILTQLNEHRIPFNEEDGVYHTKDADDNHIRLSLQSDEQPLI